MRERQILLPRQTCNPNDISPHYEVGNGVHPSDIAPSNPKLIQTSTTREDVVTVAPEECRHHSALSVRPCPLTIDHRLSLQTRSLVIQVEERNGVGFEHLFWILIGIDHVEI